MSFKDFGKNLKLNLILQTYFNDNLLKELEKRMPTVVNTNKTAL